MDYLTGLNPCRRYNQTTTSGQMIFYIFIFLYLCFIFYILYVYIYTSSFYDQCRRYNQTKTSGQIFDVSLKVSHFNHTWPFFIGTLFAGSVPCTCLNWRLKTCSDCRLSVYLFVFSRRLKRSGLPFIIRLSRLYINLWNIDSSINSTMCIYTYTYKTWCVGAIDEGPFAFGVFRFSALLCRAWQLYVFFPLIFCHIFSSFCIFFWAWPSVITLKILE